jgi:cysteinyl-tRNA synthetase
MKKISTLFIFIFFLSCTSNTIFKKPKDLIPRDTMSLLLQEMMIASSATFIANKKQQKNINYMPFVYDKFKIDSTRFDLSNYYYMSKIDVYQEIVESAKNSLALRNDVFKKTRQRLEAIRKDSIDCVKSNQKGLKAIRKDSLKTDREGLDSLKILRNLNSLKTIKKDLDTLFIRK